MTRKQLTLLVGFLMALSFLAGNLLSRRVLAEPLANPQTSQPAYANIPRWEFKIVRSFQETDNSLEAKLNRWGDQGFDVEKYQVISDGQSREYSLILMKRQKK